MKFTLFSVKLFIVLLFVMVIYLGVQSQNTTARGEILKSGRVAFCTENYSYDNTLYYQIEFQQFQSTTQAENAASSIQDTYVSSISNGERRGCFRIYEEANTVYIMTPWNANPEVMDAMDFETNELAQSRCIRKLNNPELIIDHFVAGRRFSNINYEPPTEEVSLAINRPIGYLNIHGFEGYFPQPSAELVPLYTRTDGHYFMIPLDELVGIELVPEFGQLEQADTQIIADYFAIELAKSGFTPVPAEMIGTNGRPSNPHTIAGIGQYYLQDANATQLEMVFQLVETTKLRIDIVFKTASVSSDNIQGAGYWGSGGMAGQSINTTDRASFIQAQAANNWLEQSQQLMGDIFSFHVFANETTSELRLIELENGNPGQLIVQRDDIIATCSSEFVPNWR